MTKQPNKRFTASAQPLPEAPDFGKDGSSTAGEKQLRDSVKRFASEIRQSHGLLERKAAKRVCRRLEYLITPRPRTGRPPEERITQATEMFERQRRSANGCRVNWNEIAQRCISGYGQLRSIYRRRVELDKLRSAVYARLGRRKTNKISTSHKSE